MRTVLLATVLAGDARPSGRSRGGHPGGASRTTRRSSRADGFDGRGCPTLSRSWAGRSRRAGHNASARRDARRRTQARPVQPGRPRRRGRLEGPRLHRKWREACPGTGVDIIDVSDPEPGEDRRHARLRGHLHGGHAGDEDPRPRHPRDRPQDCGNSETEGTVGLELYDITDPRNPQFLSLFNGEDFRMEPSDEPRARARARLHQDARRPDAGAARVARPRGAHRDPPLFDDGIGDLLIVDITDPSNPIASATGESPGAGARARRLPGRPRGEATRARSTTGAAPTRTARSRTCPTGTRASSSSTSATRLTPASSGRAAYAPGEEGNAHSVDESPSGKFLAAADEDFSPFELQFTSSAFAGLRDAFEGAFTAPIVALDDRAMDGEVVHVGRGCPADPALGLPVADPYLADPAGKIALIERGVYRFDNKIARRSSPARSARSSTTTPRTARRRS